MDFTLTTYYQLLHSLLQHNFTFQRFDQFLKKPIIKAVILRHDVDRLPANSLVTAEIENKLGIYGSYYFRAVSESWDEGIIRKIALLGHEIGYHYENLTTCKGDFKNAIVDFNINLTRLRNIVPVNTICMHGSPLSKWDSRLLWDKYNYREFGIIGEPYFDIDFNNVLYLTDTGRRWDGEKVNVRDKIRMNVVGKLGEVNDNSDSCPQKEENESIDFKNTSLKFRSTFDVVEAAGKGLLPDRIMITIHPQRWTNKPIPWLKELFLQNVKNVVKRYFYV